MVVCVWSTYAACYSVWHRPLAAWVGFMVSSGTAVLLMQSYSRRLGYRQITHLGLGLSAFGLLLMCFLSGQQFSPLIWILTSLPVFAFCFLSTREGVAWTVIILILVFLIHLSSFVVQVPGEFRVSTWETCGYQLVATVLLTLVAGVVKVLSAKHLRAVKLAVNEAELASATRAKFISHVSHEMRHPLQSIIGALELLGQDAVSEQNRILLKQAQRDASLLCNLVDSTLLFADLNEGKYTTQAQVFTLEEVAEVLDFRYAESFAEKRIALHLRYAEDTVFEGERSALVHLVGILLENAHKFTAPENSVSVDFYHERDALTVVVTDTGRGMSREEMLKIQEPFHRSDCLAERKERGFGLGLAVLDKMVNHLNGKWGVESELGAGSRFWLTLPVRVLLDDLENFRHSLRILVVDDDLVCLRVTRRLLESLGHQVEVCERSLELIGLLSSADYDLVFMDCQMPELDGYDAARSLRENGYGRPIIALTANTSLADRRRCLDSGMNGVVAKPASLAKLKLAVRIYSVYQIKPVLSLEFSFPQNS